MYDWKATMLQGFSRIFLGEFWFFGIFRNFRTCEHPALAKRYLVRLLPSSKTFHDFYANISDRLISTRYHLLEGTYFQNDFQLISLSYGKSLE